MSKITLPALAVLFTLAALPSCRKLTDFIHDHPDAHDSLCRIVSKSLTPVDGPAKYNIIYNAKGNPVTMKDSFPVYGTLDQYFRYDRLGRLSDYMGCYPGNFGAVVWRKYAYIRPDYVMDTAIYYETGDVRDPSRPIAKNSFDYYIYAYTLDAHGRIIKTWSVPIDPSQPPVVTDTYTYDTNGNLSLPSPDLSYDDKVNPYRTNKVWQFLYKDYSRNNMVKIDYFFFTNYNSFGLPLNLRNLQAYNLYLFGNYNWASETDISYACSMLKWPVNY